MEAFLLVPAEGEGEVENEATEEGEEMRGAGESGGSWLARLATGFGGRKANPA